ncbi:MAG: hypothetical protein NC321_15875, partial [Clostridium sp.]|nr:hypothetical protein [Clostridium sp.]
MNRRVNSILSYYVLLKRQDSHKSLVGTLSLREKRNGTKFKSRAASFSLTTVVFQEPSRDSCLP